MIKQKRPRASRKNLVELDKSSGAARYYDRMRRDVEVDLGGRLMLSRIEDELVKAFCGSATRLEYLNHQVLLGDVSEVPVADFSNLCSVMLRIGSRLGFGRRARNITPSLSDIVGDYVDSSSEESA
jgi:hypothetical protein